MTLRPRIALVHAFAASMAPIIGEFSRAWPQAQTFNLLDESLYLDHADAPGVPADLRQRIELLLACAVTAGAAAILFTGSLFGGAVKAARRAFDLPVLSAYEAMIEEAFEFGPRLALLTTVERSLDLMRADIERYAAVSGRAFELQACHVVGALPALQRGDVGAHDALIVEAAGQLRECDVLMLGQFSMASAHYRLEQSRKVLTSPECAVRKLKQLLHA